MAKDPKKKVSPQARGRIKNAREEQARARNKDRKIVSSRDGTWADMGPKTGSGYAAKSHGPLVGKETKVRSGEKSSRTFLEGRVRKDGSQGFVRGKK